MCGIAGYIGFENANALSVKANEVQKHRGPDNQSIWSDEYISFAFQRLSIIDISDRSNQPFHKHNLVIVFNGEIYNYHEIKAKLINEKSSVFTTTSDTEVLLEAYFQYGLQSLDLLVGMFSFAIYDKDSSELLLVRDHFGIKPLYYTRIGSSFAFASELQTLLSIPGFSKQINMKSLCGILANLWMPEQDSMFDNCSKLLPGHYLILSKNGSIQIKQYWKLNTSNRLTLPESMIIEQLDEVLQQSVKRHLLADVPLASFLSGGLDSSLIAVMAKKYKKDLSTYTIAFRNEDNRIEKMPADSKYAVLLAQKEQFNHREIYLEPDISKLITDMAGMCDEPLGDLALINTYLICKDARSRGVKVLLSGVGADEIFMGYRRQKAVLIAQKFKGMPVAMRKSIDSMVSLMPVKFMGTGIVPVRWAKRFLKFANLETETAYRLSGSYFEDNALSKIFNKDILQYFRQIQEEHGAVFFDGYEKDVINQMCHTDLQTFLVSHNLHYTDRASMHASVEVRTPFVDKLVVEYAMSIPGEFKYKNSESKYILKKVAERYLPADITYRKKASFGVPIRTWISNQLRHMVDDLLSEDAVRNRGLFNVSEVAKLVKEDRAGKKDNAYQLLQLMNIELWMRLSGSITY